MNDKEENKDIRFVTVKGAKYLRAEDVAAFIVTMAASEETDVRNRFNEAAFNLLGKKK